MGKPSALAVGVQPPFDDLAVHVRVGDGEQGELGSEGVPQAGVGVGRTFLDLAAPGAVVDRFALGVPLVELTRVLEGAVEARVEGPLPFLGAFDVDAAQHPFPGVGGGFADALQAPGGLPFEVQASLFGGDEARGDPHLDGLAVPRGEFDVSRAFALDGLTSGGQAIEDALEVEGEIARRRSAVGAGVAGDPVAGGLEAGVSREIEDEASGLHPGVERDAPDRRAFGGGDLGGRLDLFEPDTEVVGPHDGGRRIVGHGAGFGVQQDGTALRRDGKMTVIPRPRRGLVGRADTIERFRARLEEEPLPEVADVLDGPVGHAERARKGGGGRCRG